MNEDIVREAELLVERLNLRNFCEMAKPGGAGSILWIESITVTEVIYPEKKCKAMRLLMGLKKVFAHFKQLIFQRKKGLLWQLQNSLQDWTWNN